MLPAHTYKVEYRYFEVKGTKIALNFLGPHRLWQCKPILFCF